MVGGVRDPSVATEFDTAESQNEQQGPEATRTLTIVPVGTCLRLFLLLLYLLNNLIKQIIQKFMGILMHS